jgi:hypothetical protein
MSGKIFINYRRDDSAASAGRLYDRLTTRFPSSGLFIDVDNLDAGVDFVEAIEQNVGSCDVLIAVIGRHWLTSSDENGRRRLDNTEDFVRLEIATALKRGIRVIPVLVDGASMPQSAELPEDLKALARRHALEVSHNRFNTDTERLLGAVERVVRAEEPSTLPARSVESPATESPKASSRADVTRDHQTEAATKAPPPLIKTPARDAVDTRESIRDASAEAPEMVPVENAKAEPTVGQQSERQLPRDQETAFPSPKEQRPFLQRPRVWATLAIASVLVVVVSAFFVVSTESRKKPFPSPIATPATPSKPAASPADVSMSATIEKPFVSSLGMKFVPVPGTNVLFSLWETRVKDYQAFCDATGRSWEKPRFEQSPDHPASRRQRLPGSSHRLR